MPGKAQAQAKRGRAPPRAENFSDKIRKEASAQEGAAKIFPRSVRKAAEGQRPKATQTTKQKNRQMAVFLFGARVTEVEEPISRSVFIQIEFNEVVEPKGLSSRDLARLVKTYGSYVNAGKAIGASEAFVRQNCFKAMPV